jgi:hypothetical protein
VNHTSDSMAVFGSGQELTRRKELISAGLVDDTSNKSAIYRLKIAKYTCPGANRRWNRTCDFGQRETREYYEFERGEFNHSTDRRWLGGCDWTTARGIFARRAVSLNRARLHRRSAWKLGLQTVSIARNLYFTYRWHKLPHSLGNHRSGGICGLPGGTEEATICLKEDQPSKRTYV